MLSPAGQPRPKFNASRAAKQKVASCAGKMLINFAHVGNGGPGGLQKRCPRTRETVTSSKRYAPVYVKHLLGRSRSHETPSRLDRYTQFGKLGRPEAQVAPQNCCSRVRETLTFCKKHVPAYVKYHFQHFGPCRCGPGGAPCRAHLGSPTQTRARRPPKNIFPCR